MCGITAYLTSETSVNKACFKTLIQSLQALQNRGYDSCGVIDSDLITEMHVPTVSNDAGATLTSIGLDLGPDFSYSSSNMTETVGTYNEQGNGPSGGPWNHLQIDVNFTLSEGDWAVLTGRADINPIPIPSAFWLLGSAFIGFVGLRKRLQS